MSSAPSGPVRCAYLLYIAKVPPDLRPLIDPASKIWPKRVAKIIDFPLKSPIRKMK
jgi:hypothetical protein